MLEEELQRIHDAELGVAITWLCDWRIHLRLSHKNGAVAAEGNVKEVSDVSPWLEEAIKKYFPKANYEYAANPPAENPGKLDRSA